MKLIIGNKAYSSWSMRGWLAARQSGLAFEEVVVSLYDADWPERRTAADLAPSGGRVPILWDGEAAVWDSLAIIEYLAERAGQARFWPSDTAARALARSIAAEMHSGFAALRSKHTMNVRRHYGAAPPDADVMAELARLETLWAGREGEFLFGDFGAADIMFAPVATRIDTYALPVSPGARRYADALLAQPFVAEWIAAAQSEPWVIDKFENTAG